MNKQQNIEHLTNAVAKEREHAAEQSPLENSEDFLDAVTRAFIRGAASAMGLVMRGRGTPSELCDVERAIIEAGTNLGVYPNMFMRYEVIGGRKCVCFMPHGYADPIVLPVITSGSRDAANAWTWNGSRDKPTLRPSIKTTHADGTVSHLWLTDGVCHYLDDSTDGNAGKSLPLLPLPV